MKTTSGAPPGHCGDAGCLLCRMHAAGRSDGRYAVHMALLQLQLVRDECVWALVNALRIPRLLDWLTRRVRR